MKKLILPILLVLSMCINASAWCPTVVTGGTQAAASCTTSNDSSQWTRGDNSSPGTNFTLYEATMVVLGATTTITEYLIEGYDQYYDDYRGDVTISFWDGDTTDPDAISTTPIITNSSKNLANPWQTAATQDPDYQAKTFTLATPFQVSAGTYWLVRTYANGCYPYWVKDYKTSDNNRYCYSEDGETWSCIADYYLRSTVMGCQP